MNSQNQHQEDVHMEIDNTADITPKEPMEWSTDETLLWLMQSEDMELDDRHDSLQDFKFIRADKPPSTPDIPNGDIPTTLTPNRLKISRKVKSFNILRLITQGIIKPKGLHSHRPKRSGRHHSKSRLRPKHT